MDRKTRDELLTLFQSKLNNAMKLYLETCSRCGMCFDACHVYNSMPEAKYIAAYRAEIVRKIYKKYFKLQGKILPFIDETKELTGRALEELNEAAWSCTGCRRCMVYCPFGIDTQMLMSIAKLLLIGSDTEPKILTMLADSSVQKGEMIDLFKDNFITALKNIEKDVIAKWKSEAGKEVIPTEVSEADMMYVALAGAHSIIPVAAILNAAHEKWTLSFFEAVNFGAFVGDPAKTKLILKRIVDEAIKLKVKEVVICECGTAFRIMKQQEHKLPFKVSFVEEVIVRYIREGRIKLKSDLFTDPVTYHDPCQIARNGGVIEDPRFIINKLAADFKEMSPDSKYNWCCGGGGGLVALGDETLDFRMKSSKVKAEQIQETGAKILTTACENCHTQLSNINDHYKLNVEVKFLSGMVADALVQ